MTHPTAHCKFEIRYVPEDVPFNAERLPSKSEFEKIWDRVRRNRLEHPFPEKQRVLFHRTPWSPLRYKFLEKPNWVNPKYPVREY